jgi:hypothetical protein
MDGYCYRWTGWNNWLVSKRLDQTQVGDPLDLTTLNGLPPNGSPTLQGFTSDSFCNTVACFEQLDGVWGVVALIVPAGATISLPIVNRPDGQPNGFCDSTFCYYYTPGGDFTGTWSVTTFSGIPVVFPTPQIPTTPTKPVKAGGADFTAADAGDYTFGQWTYTIYFNSSLNKWDARVAAYNGPQTIDLLPVTSTIVSLQSTVVSVTTTPDAQLTIP